MISILKSVLIVGPLNKVLDELDMLPSMIINDWQLAGTLGKVVERHGHAMIFTGLYSLLLPKRELFLGNVQQEKQQVRLLIYKVIRVDIGAIGESTAGFSINKSFFSGTSYDSNLCRMLVFTSVSSSLLLRARTTSCGVKIPGVAKETLVEGLPNCSKALEVITHLELEGCPESLQVIQGSLRS